MLLLQVICVALGALLIVAGLALWSPPLAMVAAGAGLAAAGLFVDFGGGRASR